MRGTILGASLLALAVAGAAQAEPTEPDDPSDSQPIAVGSAVTPKLRELGEAHFWPHARKAGDLSSPGAT